MFQFKTQWRQIWYAAPSVVAALTLGTLGCLATAGPSRATEIFPISDALSEPGLLTIKGPGVDESVYVSPLELEAADEAGSHGWMGDLIGFFVDMLDFITAGWNGQSSGGGGAGGVGGGSGGLSRSQTQQIGGLVSYGAQIVHFHVDDGDLSDQLTGIQGAIWQIENPTYTIGGGSDGIENDLEQDLALAGGLDAPYQTITLGNGSDQVLAVASDVPEPGAWALMIFGALVLGARLRWTKTQDGQTLVAA